MSVELTSLFVSSTSDLKDEREAIRGMIQKLQIDRQISAYISDYDSRAGDTPEERVREEIHAAELFVLILGGKYGSPHPAAKNGHPSICEWELGQARKLWGPPVISLMKDHPPETIEEPQRRFREQVQGFCAGTWLRKFSTAGEVTEILNRVITSWALGEVLALKKLLVMSLSTLVATGVLFFSFSWLQDHVTARYLAGGVLVSDVALLGLNGHVLKRVLR